LALVGDSDDALVRPTRRFLARPYEPLRTGKTFGFSFFGFLTSFLRLLLPLPITDSLFEFTNPGDY
jgi:hypothetical protein